MTAPPDHKPRGYVYQWSPFQFEQWGVNISRENPLEGYQARRYRNVEPLYDQAAIAAAEARGLRMAAEVAQSFDKSIMSSTVLDVRAHQIAAAILALIPAPPDDGGDEEGPCTCCDDTGITGQTERFCQCNIGRAMLAADDGGDT
jgi:hypothetical protein